jgi:hypothetical protein
VNIYPPYFDFSEFESTTTVPCDSVLPPPLLLLLLLAAACT